jgi:Flp pilus assembly protein TadG
MILGGALGIVSRLLRAGENAGAAAVEFAFFVPLFLIIVAGTVDFGYLIYITSQLTFAVSAGSQYAENNAAMVSSNPSGLSTNIQTVVENANGAGWATGTVNVNNGNDSTHCYCPTGSPGSWTWGSAVACGSSCAGGGVAGQFVAITASRSVSPLFPTYGLAYNGTISRSAMVETQ